MKKKPVFTQGLAHGIDEAQVDTEDMDVVRKPRWITALGCLRYSDLFASGTRLILVTELVLTTTFFRIVGRRDSSLESRC